MRIPLSRLGFFVCLFLFFLCVLNICWMCRAVHSILHSCELTIPRSTLTSNSPVSFYRWRHWGTGRGKATWLRPQSRSHGSQEPTSEAIMININLTPTYRATFYHCAMYFKYSFQTILGWNLSPENTQWSFTTQSHSYMYVCMCVYIFLCFLGLHLWHIEVPRLGVESELQLPVYTIPQPF